jgi:WD40 repeat protein
MEFNSNQMSFNGIPWNYQDPQYQMQQQQFAFEASNVMLNMQAALVEQNALQITYNAQQQAEQIIFAAKQEAAKIISDAKESVKREVNRLQFEATIALQQALLDVQEYNYLSHEQGFIRVMRVDGERDLIFSAGTDGAIKIWNLSTFQCSREIECHSDWINALVLRSDKNIVISTGDDKIIKVYDFNEKKKVSSLEEHTDWVRTLSICKNNKKWTHCKIN